MEMPTSEKSDLKFLKLPTKLEMTKNKRYSTIIQDDFVDRVERPQTVQK
jgi:hypothetical protein